MRIGLIGSGNIGTVLGRAWASTGHEVRFSYSRNPARVHQLVSSLGPMASSGSVGEAAVFGEVVVLSVPWPRVRDAIGLAGDLAGRILIDTTNPFGEPGGPPILDPSVTSAAAQVVQITPGARLVKAFNTLYYATLEQQARRAGGWLGLPVSGDDTAAKDVTGGLVRDIGFEPVDIGGLAGVGRQEPGGPLYGSEMTPAQIRSTIEGQ